MNKEAKSGRLAHGTNFKSPWWVVLFVSLGAMLGGYGVYYGIFPVGVYETDSPWRKLMETGSLLVLAAGIVGFSTSLIWGLVKDIAIWHGGSSSRPADAVATPS